MRGLKLMPLLASFLQAETPLIEGNARRPMRMISGDLGCWDCATLPKYKTRAAFEHRDLPLSKHVWARRAETAVAWRRYTLSNIDPINPGDFEETLKAFALKHKADPKRAMAALSDVNLAEGVAHEVSIDAALAENHQ